MTLQPSGYFAQDTTHGVEVVLACSTVKPATSVVSEGWVKW